MNVVFNPKAGLIIIPVEIEGPSGSAILQLAFDTGATKTLSLLAQEWMGYWD